MSTSPPQKPATQHAGQPDASPPTDSDRVASDAERLIARLADLAPVTVAFSGGVDSSVVAAAARRADPHDCLAVTAASPSVPVWQLDTARQVASVVGIPHRVVSTDEVSRPDYRRNDGRRCYHCKETLYATLTTLAKESLAKESLADESLADQTRRTIVSGTNADDLGDYRPGIDAASAAGVRAPLAELGITKPRVRALAAFFGLPNADLPAAPCLASRIAYGVEVTPERLGMVEAAEGWLRDRGFSDLRVRLHADLLARVEVPPKELPRLVEPRMLADLDRQLTSIGFRFVTVDTRGLRSGSLNPPLVTLGPPSSATPTADQPIADQPIADQPIADQLADDQHADDRRSTPRRPTRRRPTRRDER